MKSLAILFILAGCGTGWAASTETCPAVEGGEWISPRVSFHESRPIESLEYRFELSTYGVSLCQDQYFLWRKVPYKIEWKCQEYRGMIWNEAAPCYREIGFREDGIVIWRHTDQALKDAQEREQKSKPYKEEIK